jgi:hypothetical protein
MTAVPACTHPGSECFGVSCSGTGRVAVHLQIRRCLPYNHCAIHRLKKRVFLHLVSVTPSRESCKPDTCGAVPEALRSQGWHVGRWKLVAPKIRRLIAPDPVIIQVNEHKTTRVTLTYRSRTIKGRNALSVYGRPGKVFGDVRSASRYRDLAALGHALHGTKLGCDHLQKLPVISTGKVDGASADCRLLSHRVTLQVWRVVRKLPYVTGFGSVRGWEAVGPNWVIEPHEDGRDVVPRIQIALGGQIVDFKCWSPRFHPKCN